MERRFKVKGMTCAVCQTTIENEVRKLDGVKEVSVSLLSNLMIVDYDELKNNPVKIIKSVKKSGYNAFLFGEETEISKDSKTELNEMKTRLFVSILFFVPLMYLSMGPMISLPIPIFMENTEGALLYGLTQFLLVIPIVVFNYQYFKIGFIHLVRRKPNMDTLVAIGSFASLLYSIVGLYIIAYGFSVSNYRIIDQAVMNLYFEAAGSILTLVTVGKFIESLSKGQTKTEIEKLMKLQPTTAFLLINGQIQEVDASSIQENDILLVKPGMKIPVDGIVIEGSSAVDESMISGESIPVDKYVDDKLISATINQSGVLKMKATKVGKDTTLNQIINLVEKASMTKAPIQKLADRISLYFVPVVILISITSFSVWMILGYSFAFSLSMAVTVLVISCPCALGLATPVAMMVGTGKGAEYGILFKSAKSLQQSEKIDTIILDKTGTITLGKPTVIDFFTYNSNKLMLYSQIIKSLENKSTHPLAKAISSFLQEDYNEVDLTEVEEVAGYGLKGTYQKKKYYIGNENWMHRYNIDTILYQEKIDKFKSDGKTIVLFAEEEKLQVLISLQDEIKINSQEAIRNFQNDNFEVIMLTGDNQISANYWQKRLNIVHVYANVLPTQKNDIVLEYINKGKKVAMIGDGINDSIALVSSTVGISLGAGSDIAQDSADIILIKNDIMDAYYALKLSKKTMKNVRLNLFLAFIYNLLGIPLAAGIFYISFGLKLNPVFGSLAMSLSSVSVVLNALRLKLIHFQKGEINEKNSLY